MSYPGAMRIYPYEVIPGEHLLILGKKTYSISSVRQNSAGLFVLKLIVMDRMGGVDYYFAEPSKLIEVAKIWPSPF